MEFDVNDLDGKDSYQWRLEWKKCASLPQLVQKLIKCPVKNCLLPFLYCWSCRSSPPTDSCKTHTNPCAQCFQIWQVSARYCTFLDFLAHCWLIFPSCTCELRIYVLMTSPTGYSLFVINSALFLKLHLFADFRTLGNETTKSNR